MNFWFFYKNYLGERTVFGSAHPLKMKVADLNRHIDKILETKAVVRFGKLMISVLINIEEIGIPLKHCFWAKRRHNS